MMQSGARRIGVAQMLAGGVTTGIAIARQMRLLPPAAVRHRAAVASKRLQSSAPRGLAQLVRRSRGGPVMHVIGQKLPPASPRAVRHDAHVPIRPPRTAPPMTATRIVHVAMATMMRTPRRIGGAVASARAPIGASTATASPRRPAARVRRPAVPAIRADGRRPPPNVASPRHRSGRTRAIEGHALPDQPATLPTAPPGRRTHPFAMFARTTATFAMAPVASAGMPAPGPGLSPVRRAAAPLPASPSLRATDMNATIEDGRLGRWLDDYLADAVIRPQSGLSAMDERLTPVFPGAPLS